jgi:hypothetical protein
MSTSTSTSTLDSFVADFKVRLNKIDKSSLQQWQFAYKEVIFAMGLKILEQFPRNALGPEPTAKGHATAEALVIHPAGGGPGGGPIIHAGGPGGGPIIHLATAVLGLAPPPPPPPP